MTKTGYFSIIKLEMVSMKFLHNKKKIIKIGLFIVLFILFLCIPNKIELELNGDKQELLSWNEDYEEKGAILQKCSFFSCRSIKKGIKITGNVDTSKVGTYKITYSIKYDKKNYSNERTITIIDNEIPVIELLGNKELTCQGNKYIEEGYKASDNYDGDITNKVTIRSFENGIHYYVKDSARNTIEVIRKRLYEDNEAPTIELKGGQEVSVFIDTNYEEPGYKAIDNCDGDITDQVVVKGIINTSIPGEYKLTYTVSDEFNNTTTVERKVIVYSFNTESKEAYITALNEYIKEKNYNVSIIYYNLDNKYTYKYNENKKYYGASLIKTVAAMYAYENMNVNDSIKEYVKPMIEKSSNKAYLNLLKKIGYNNLKNYGVSLGATNTLSGYDKFGDTTAEDQLIYWQHLYELINTIKLKDELKSYFINDYHNHLAFDGAPQIVHKYGYYADVFHDVGIVYDKSPYVVIILTQEGYDNYSEIISDLSQKIYKLNQL